MDSNWFDSRYISLVLSMFKTARYEENKKSIKYAHKYIYISMSGLKSSYDDIISAINDF